MYVSGNLKVSGSDPFMVVMVRPVSPPSILEIRMEGNMFVTHYLMDMKCTFFDARYEVNDGHIILYAIDMYTGNMGTCNRCFIVSNPRYYNSQLPHLCKNT